MRRNLRIWASGIAMILAVAPSHAVMTEVKDERFVRGGVYVIARDVEKTTKFYEGIFERQPSFKTPKFVGFDVAGALFAVVSRATFAPHAVNGDNVVPYIRVKDATVEYERISKLAPEAIGDNKLIQDGPLKLFKLTDPDGNIVEFYSFAT